jgi:hypothetical protein
LPDYYVISINGLSGENYFSSGRGITYQVFGTTHYFELFFNSPGPTGLTIGTVTKASISDKVLIQQSGSGTPMKLIEVSKLINSPVYTDVSSITGSLANYKFAFYDNISEPYEADVATVRNFILSDGVVTSFNGKTGSVGISAGTNISISQSGNTFTISLSPSNYTIGLTAPGSPVNGNKWFDTSTGIEFTYINDGTSSQWIQI